MKHFSLQVICPHCGSAADVISMTLDDIGVFTCGSCCEEFTAEQAADKLAAAADRWRKVATWIEDARSL